MYEYVRGYIKTKGDGFIILACLSVGYKLLCSDKLIESYDTTAEDVLVPVHLEHTEKNMNLYGFVDIEEREAFLALIKIPAIGCKVALRILSALTPGDLKYLQGAKNIGDLSKVKGIGDKTAYKIINMLKL
jgi:Holliday junction DNA helicase RuvA